MVKKTGRLWHESAFILKYRSREDDVHAFGSLGSGGGVTSAVRLSNKVSLRSEPFRKQKT